MAFVVNPEGRIKRCELHDNGIGRDATELLRKVQAAIYVAKHPGEERPAGLAVRCGDVLAARQRGRARRR